MERYTNYFKEISRCVDFVIDSVGKDIRICIPLALGKPNQFINHLYRRAKSDPGLQLKIYTALSPEKPSGGSELERRIIDPMAERIFGGYPDLEYMKDLRNGGLPENVELIEFYFKAGGSLNVPSAQQNYIGSNYTHAVRDIINQNINVAAQIVSKETIDGRTSYSMSCNPDLHLDLIQKMREKAKNGHKFVSVGQVNSNLPFMEGDAQVGPEMYDAVIDNPDYNFRLFAPPKLAVQNSDHMIGLNASALIQDGGTLQIGIGALGDAVVSGLLLRQQNNDIYKKVLADSGISSNFASTINSYGGTDTFNEGLYASTEMLVDGFIHLYKNGILKRKVYDDPSIQSLLNEKKISQDITPQTLNALMENNVIGDRITAKDFDFLQKYGILKEDLSYAGDTIHNGTKSYDTDLSDASNLERVMSGCLGNELKGGVVLHGGFFLGPQSFYDDLHQMNGDRKHFHMTSVSYVNQLYGNEELKRLQRIKARFINAGMIVNLFGAVTSDALEDGRIVSGVGGQYNFVAMAHEFEDARGILMIKSTRQKGKKVCSNIVYNYGHTTIPRHLKDIIITEYGIADLRGKSDKETISSLLNITDSRFQEKLMRQAKKAGKLPSNYSIPDRFRCNTPEMIENVLSSYKSDGYFLKFPFGTDFTNDELVLIGSLRKLKEDIAAKKISYSKLKQSFSTVPSAARPYLERMQLDLPHGLKEKVLQKAVVYALMNSNSI